MQFPFAFRQYFAIPATLPIYLIHHFDILQNLSSDLVKPIIHREGKHVLFIHKHKMMKYITLFLTILIFHTNHCIGQDNGKVYKIKLQLLNKNIEEGYLYAAADSGVYIAFGANNSSINAHHFFPSGSIKHLSIRRKGKIGRSMLYGSLAGAATLAGVAVVSNGGDDFLATEAIVGSAIAGAMIGALSGLMAGAFNNVEYNINGQQSSYLKILPKIQKKAFKQN